MTQHVDYKALSKRLTTIQFPNIRITPSSFLVDLEDIDRLIEEYRQRTFTTRKKITKVLRPFEIGQAFNDDVRNLLGWLQDAIGVYNVPDVLSGRSHSWSKMSSVNPNEGLQGTGWPDYLGDPSIQKNGGGRVVVVLSDEGIKWLNSIAETVKGYISEDVPMENEKTTLYHYSSPNGEVEKLEQDEFSRLLREFYSAEFDPIWEGRS